MSAKRGGPFRWLVVSAMVFASAGPGAVPGARAEPGPDLGAPVSRDLAEVVSGASALDGAPAAAPPDGAVPAAGAGDRSQSSLGVEPEEPEDYDPWEPFNEKMFWFNRQLDRFLLKPVATGWDTIMPDETQRALGRVFENAAMPKRLVNNVLQGKAAGAGRELLRFVLNTTVGVAGLVDVAKAAGLEPSDADTGQTFGTYGVDPGPYLVLPFLPPLTVRDGIGFGIDGLLDPAIYFAPFAASAGRTAGNTVNKRSLNLELFEDVEETSLDLYTAVRNGYLQRRAKALRE